MESRGKPLVFTRCAKHVSFPSFQHSVKSKAGAAPCGAAPVQLSAWLQKLARTEKVIAAGSPGSASLKACVQP